MKRLGYGLAAVVFTLDQLVKYWIVRVIDLPARGSIEILPVFRLTYVENIGVSMGLLNAQNDLARWGLVAVTAGIAMGVAVWLMRERAAGDVIALGLVLGGALGNIVDRIRYGYVIDFLHVFWRGHNFWVFNVADAAITLGVLILLTRALLAPKG